MRPGALLAGLLVALAAQAAEARLMLCQPEGDAARHIIRAWYEDKTDRYGHNVLDGNEYATMAVCVGPTDSLGALALLRLPEDRVFEDIEVRIADVNGDGTDELVVVESSTSGGAELAVYAAERDSEGTTASLRKIANSPPIGRRNRWLAPVGIADLNGDGQNDIAYVEKPHIGGDLRVWTMRDGELVEIARKSGFSNHRIGEDFITGGVRDCGDGPELVLPNFNWSQLMVVSYGQSGLTARPLGTRTGPDAVAAALACEN